MAVIWFEKLTAADIERVGGKGANLGEMTRTGLPVPPGFCITAEAYRNCIDAQGLWPVIAGLLADLDIDDAAALERAAEAIRQRVLQAPVPSDVAAAVRHAYRALAGEDGPVAVRSSATAEDLPEASFAGQQETYLNVRGEEELLIHVQRCWASLWTARAIAYRQRNGFDHRQVSLAVVVQRLIDPNVSGVLFTANPLNGSRDEMLINAAYGLGESVVGGQVTPDTYRIQRGRTARVIEQTRGSKAVAIRLAEGGGTAAFPVPEADRNRDALCPQDLQRLVDLGLRVEAHYGAPQDIEWCIAGGQVYLLQTRPITSLGPSAPKPRRLGRVERTIRDDILEHYPDPPYPLDYEAVTEGYEQLQQLLREAGLRVPPARTVIRMDADGIPTIEPVAPRPTLRLLALPWTIARSLARDAEAWTREHGPRFAGRLAALRAVDPDALSDEALAEHIEAAVAAASEIARIRFLEVIGPMMVRGALLRLLFRLGGEKLTAEQELLGGLTYKSLEIDRALDGLAAAALSDSALTDLMVRKEPSEIATALEATPGGRAFLERVDLFLREHGARTMKVYLPFSNRSWSEDPTVLWATLSALVRAGEAGGAEARARAAAERFAARRERVARRLPGPLRRRFLDLLERFRADHAAREATLYAIEESYVLARRGVRVAAARLTAAGALPHPDDVRFLTLSELTAVLREGHAGLRGTVLRRRRARARAAAAWQRRDGLPEVGAGDLNGLAGSPGVATGPVRVIGGPAEFGKLQPGDILVCSFTDPAWTPLFGLAAAVVADTGGPLSHAAIVAREYGIPAVLGTQVATRQLQDGEVVTVDGNRGVVLRSEPTGG